jgi:biopolymer transport protein ExbD
MKKRFQRKRPKSEPMELDITSLLDILVILLVFLLKSYNASNLKLNLVDSLKIPDSKARKLGSHSVIVQVDNEKKIWIDNKVIGKIDRSEKIIPLYEELKNRKEKAKTNNPKLVAKSINLVLDKELPYNSMQKLMHTSALAGYTEFKFIVQGNY